MGTVRIFIAFLEWTFCPRVGTASMNPSIKEETKYCHLCMGNVGPSLGKRTYGIGTANSSAEVYNNDCLLNYSKSVGDIMPHGD